MLSDSDKQYILKNFKDNQKDAVLYIKQKTGLNIYKSYDLMCEIFNIKDETQSMTKTDYKNEIKKQLEQKLKSTNKTAIPETKKKNAVLSVVMFIGKAILSILKFTFTLIGLILASLMSTLVWAIALLIIVGAVFAILFVMSNIGWIGLTFQSILSMCIVGYIIALVIAFIFSFIAILCGKDPSKPAGNFVISYLDDVNKQTLRDIEYKRRYRMMKSYIEKMGRK